MFDNKRPSNHEKALYQLFHVVVGSKPTAVSTLQLAACVDILSALPPCNHIHFSSIITAPIEKVDRLVSIYVGCQYTALIATAQLRYRVTPPASAVLPKMSFMKTLGPLYQRNVGKSVRQSYEREIGSGFGNKKTVALTHFLCT